MDSFSQFGGLVTCLVHRSTLSLQNSQLSQPDRFSSPAPFLFCLQKYRKHNVFRLLLTSERMRREPLGISNSNCPLLLAPHPQNFLQLVEERRNYFCLLISILCKLMNPLLLFQIRWGWPDLWSRSAVLICGTLH